LLSMWALVIAGGSPGNYLAGVSHRASPSRTLHVGQTGAAKRRKHSVRCDIASTAVWLNVLDVYRTLWAGIGHPGLSVGVCLYGSYGTSQPIVDVGIGSATPLIGYPTYSAGGLSCSVLFNPQIRVNSPIRVKSTMPRANGTWQVLGVTRDIEAQTPGGRWETAIMTYPA